MTLSGWVISGYALQIIFAAFEFQRRPPHAGRQSRELHFALRVGAAFQVELVESPEAVGDVHFDRGPIGGFAVGGVDGEFQRAAAQVSVYHRHVRSGWFRWGLGEHHAGQARHSGHHNKTTHRSEHSFHRLKIIIADCTAPGRALPISRWPQPIPPRRKLQYTKKFMNYIYGINTVTEGLKARGRAFQWVGVAKERHDLRLQRLVDDCRRQNVSVRFLSRAELDDIAGHNGHQGVVAATSAKAYADLDDILAVKRGDFSLLVVLDGVEDPHNLGAIIRTADAAGADGVVIPERRAVGVNETVAKVSAGASEHLPVAKVTNISRTLEELKSRNVWTVGLDERGEQAYDAARLQNGLRHRTGRGGQRPARTGPQEMRFPGFNSNAGKSAVAQCLGSHGSSTVRGPTSAADQIMRFLCALCVLCGLSSCAAALDRNAFTFTRYDLRVQLEPEQQRLSVEGKITLRNDSNAPQKNLSLQISSTLGWRSIQMEGQPVDFLIQTYTSDIDHTGALSEAIVTPPKEVQPKAEIELEVRYEGTIPLNATRLTRIGLPPDVAAHSDWDQIGATFSAVRGVGNVVWYPVAMDAANLSEGRDLFERLGAWRVRQRSGQFILHARSMRDDGSDPPQVIVGSQPCQQMLESMGRAQQASADCQFDQLGLFGPVIVAGHYYGLNEAAIIVNYLPEHEAAARIHATSAAKVVPFITEWFGAPRTQVEVTELADAKAAPFESGTLLLTPLATADPQLAEITEVHQLAHAAFASPRPWIYEGLAHFAQALYVERERGRDAALDFMGLHRPAVADAEKAIAEEHNPKSEEDQSLINTYTEEFYRSKAAYVWSMLRDIAGDAPLKKALASYQANQDNQPVYVQRLIETQAHRDLAWFFDDWVYHDQGLPDFRIESVYPAAIPAGGYLLTITVENLGAAAAEVPVIVKMKEGDLARRLQVKGKSKNSIRIEVPYLPPEVVVNDGSVPETDLTNNRFTVAK